MARRYRKRGLDRTARRMVSFLERHGVRGASVLEVGGGVGEIQIELLKRGADRTLNLELSPAYESEATQLLRETGFEARGERRLHDIAVEPDAVAPADVVVLHRVVCCYPDYERLLGAAGARAQQLFVFSYPRRNALSRLLIAVQNLGFRIRRSRVPHLRAPAGLDARGPRRARPPGRVRAQGSRLAGDRPGAIASQPSRHHGEPGAIPGLTRSGVGDDRVAGPLSRAGLGRKLERSIPSPNIRS